jgi:phosphoglycolate phosphatase
LTLRLAIWDMDGTLVDSRQHIQRAMEEAFRQVRLPCPEYEATRKIVGLSLVEGCRQLAPPEAGDALVSRLAEAYRGAFIALRADPDYHEPLYAGARETLDRLKDEGWLIGLATGKTHRGLEAIFTVHPLRPYFDTIWCADDGPGKPHPFMVEQGMRSLGADPAHTVMIGDATFDIIMARAAGVTSHGVGWGFGRSDELLAAGADEVHEDFASLQRALTRFGV